MALVSRSASEAAAGLQRKICQGAAVRTAAEPQALARSAVGGAFARSCLASGWIADRALRSLCRHGDDVTPSDRPRCSAPPYSCSLLRHVWRHICNPAALAQYAVLARSVSTPAVLRDRG
jgi:hypothetical protein